jgi:hypothetical protein
MKSTRNATPNEAKQIACLESRIYHIDMIMVRIRTMKYKIKLFLIKMN